ncbi:MAG: hypothetical protein ACP5M9_00500 [Candidatus Micrarchaeia archaeon]
MGKTSALTRLKKTSISVKDIASQLWCEKQMELFITTGGYTTPAMEKGSAMHNNLQAQVFKALPIEPISYGDRLFKWAFETYTSISNIYKEGYARELKIYGSINGFKVSGQIDELRIQDNKLIIVEDKTIKNDNKGSVISLRFDADKLQANIYGLLLGDIKNKNYTFDNFANSFGIDKLNMSKEFLSGLDSLGLKKENQDLSRIYKLMFDSYVSLPALSDLIKIRYMDRETKSIISELDIKYSKDEVSKDLVSLMGYWSGDREAMPVPEDKKWRCKYCKFFGNKCTTWWVGEQTK